MSYPYIDHAGNAYRAAADELFRLAKEAGFTWVKLETEHPSGGASASRSWGAPSAKTGKGESFEDANARRYEPGGDCYAGTDTPLQMGAALTPVRKLAGFESDESAVNTSSESEVIHDTRDPLPYVIDLARRHYEEIGFIPRPRLEQYRDNGQIWLDRENGEPCGFLVWGNGWPILRVYQVCIQYDAQRRLHGAALIGRLIRKAEAEGYERISCWVADDIPANDFWRSMGFVLSGDRPGGAKRGRMHNAWVYWCAHPMQLRIA